MTTIMGNPLLRALQGESDVFYPICGDTEVALVKFDRLVIEGFSNGSMRLQFMKGDEFVADVPFFGPLKHGQMFYLSVRGGIEGDITI